MYIFIIAITLLILLLILIYISNNCLKITRYTVCNSKIPKSFNGTKIVHISDVHSKMFGKDNSKFFSKIYELNPDIIVMTGDIIDDSEKYIEKFAKLYSKIYKKYPTYYSIGNHERKLGYKKYKKYLNLLEKYGVNVIVNGGIYLKKGSDKIKINALKFRENMQPKLLTDTKKIQYIAKMI